MPKKKTNENLFEQKVQDLEKIVTSLESGEHNLESSLKMFEEGVALYKDCKESLVGVEQKIKVLSDSLKEEDL